MTWVKLDDQFPDHLKIEAAGPEAAWLFVAGLCYCAAQLTDGKIPKTRVARLTALRKPAPAADALVDAGLWHDRGDSYEVHDYLDYQPSRSQVMSQRDKQRDRQRKSRAGHGVSAPTPTRPDPKPTVRTKDDDHFQVVERPESSSDLDQRDVWLAYANLVAESQSEPPAKLSAFLTSVARKAKRERGSRLVEYLRICPSASTETLARWLFDDIDPVMIDRPELDQDFTPAADLKVVGQ